MSKGHDDKSNLPSSEDQGLTVEGRTTLYRAMVFSPPLDDLGQPISMEQIAADLDIPPYVASVLHYPGNKYDDWAHLQLDIREAAQTFHPALADALWDYFLDRDRRSDEFHAARAAADIALLLGIDLDDRLAYSVLAWKLAQGMADSMWKKLVQ